MTTRVDVAAARRRSARRLLARSGTALLSILIALVAAAPTALADPAGPTDYQTEIIGIEPDVDGISLEVIGGDSFVELTVDPGVEVMVLGYRGEDYLHFLADGTVLQNERSPSRWLNDDRFGDGTIPPEATPDAEPEWVQVSDDGQFAWHDHRSHWMNEARPPAAGPGDVILEAVIPMIVSGTPVEVAVRSTWVEAPTTAAPVAVGAIAALALGIVVVGRTRTGGRNRSDEPNDAAPPGPVSGIAVAALTTAGVAAIALALGFVAYTSVPSETGPSPLFWFLPAIAVVLAAAALIARRSQAFAAASILAVAALVLAFWGWLRREALVRAIIPTDAPAWLDRIGIATAIAVGVVALVAAVWTAATPAAVAPTPERSR